jgi:hypothetical protein
MKVYVALLLFMLVAARPSFGQAGGNSVESMGDKAARKSVRGFGAHLFLVEKPKEFVEKWQKPETLNIQTVSSVKPKQLFGAFILFAGCRTNAFGICDCEVDFDVYRPDGKLYAERKGLELWKQHAPSQQDMQLSVANLFLSMGAHDPAGKYIVKATVRDKRANVEFELETFFRLEEN